MIALMEQWHHTQIEIRVGVVLLYHQRLIMCRRV